MSPAQKRFGIYLIEGIKVDVLVEALTQGVERGDVLPHVTGLVRTWLPHQSVHIMSETKARHFRRVHVNCEKVLMAA